MTEEEMKELINSQLSAALEQTTESLKSEFHNSMSGLAARISKETEKKFAEFKPETPKEDEQALAYKALQEELNTIKNEREQEKLESAQLRRDKSLYEAISGLNLTHSKPFQKLFLSEFGESIVEENNQFFVTDGSNTKPLDKAVSDYLNSEDGKLFQPASSVNGSGSKPSDRKVTGEKQSLSSLMNEALKKK